MTIRLILMLALFLGLEFFAFDVFSMALMGMSGISQIILKSIYWLATIGVLGVSFASQTTLSKNWSKSTLAYSRAAFTLFIAAKFLILVLTAFGSLLFQVFDVFGWLTFDEYLNYQLSVTGLLITSIPFFLLIYGMVRNPYRYKIYKTNISIDNLAEGLENLKIIQISDIHSGSFTSPEKVQKAIDSINAQVADLVFFTGDLVNSKAIEMKDYEAIFSQIKAKHGVYSILGNHDYGDYTRWESQAAKVQNFRALLATHHKMGWDLLRNENRILTINNAQLGLIGVENASASPRFHQYGDLKKAYQGVEQTDLKLLLSHDPSHWDNEVNQLFKDISVTFSGHTHGFQFGFELSKVLRWSPSQYVYKQWAGLYQEGKQFLYVNRGFGMLGYPGRVGILPEISVIVLKKK